MADNQTAAALKAEIRLIEAALQCEYEEGRALLVEGAAETEHTGFNLAAVAARIQRRAGELAACKRILRSIA